MHTCFQKKKKKKKKSSSKNLILLTSGSSHSVHNYILAKKFPDLYNSPHPWCPNIWSDANPAIINLKSLDSRPEKSMARLRPHKPIQAARAAVAINYPSLKAEFGLLDMCPSLPWLLDQHRQEKQQKFSHCLTWLCCRGLQSRRQLRDTALLNGSDAWFTEDVCTFREWIHSHLLYFGFDVQWFLRRLRFWCGILIY